MLDTVMAFSVDKMLLKSVAKSFGDGSLDICKYNESNLEPSAGF